MGGIPLPKRRVVGIALTETTNGIGSVQTLGLQPRVTLAHDTAPRADRRARVHERCSKT